MVQAALQKVVGPKVEIKLPVRAPSSGESALRPDVRQIVTRTVHAFYPDVPIVPQQESGATDGAVFRQVGIPTYGTDQRFIKDSDDFAHGLNERLPVKSFYDGLEFWYLLLKGFASGASSSLPPPSLDLRARAPISMGVVMPRGSTFP